MGNYESTLNNGESCQHNWQCHSEFCCNPYGTGSICIDAPRSVPFGFRTCPENTVCRTVRPYRTDRLVPQRLMPGIDLHPGQVKKLLIIILGDAMVQLGIKEHTARAIQKDVNTVLIYYFYLIYYFLSNPKFINKKLFKICLRFFGKL